PIDAPLNGHSPHGCPAVPWKQCKIEAFYVLGYLQANILFMRKYIFGFITHAIIHYLLGPI
ncbi:MAG: hypothetical protein ACI89J_003560, partial [Hyphomicrobiaceae bacterium]